MESSARGCLRGSSRIFKDQSNIVIKPVMLPRCVRPMRSIRRGVMAKKLGG
jgi:hypothetical protein